MSEEITWHVCPRDQGQIVEVSWAPVGPDGALCRTRDRASSEIVYRLFPWASRGRFELWNGRVGVRRRGRRLSEEEAYRLLNAD